LESQFGFGLTLYSANKPVRRGQRRTKHAFSGREQKQLARGDFIRVLGYHRSCRRRASGNTCCHRGRRRHHRLVVCCQRCEVCPEWGGRVPDQCARALKTTLPATHRSQVSPATDVPSVRYGKDPQSLDLTSTEGETRAYLAGATVHNHVTLKPLEVRNCLKLFFVFAVVGPKLCAFCLLVFYRRTRRTSTKFTTKTRAHGRRPRCSSPRCPAPARRGSSLPCSETSGKLRRTTTAIRPSSGLAKCRTTLRLSGTPETSGGLRGAHSYKHTDRAVKTKKRDI